MKKCDACGVEKDMAALEVYPYPEDDRFDDEPFEPLLRIAVDGGREKVGYRNADVCHGCFHKLDPDMWVSKEQWDSLNPVVPHGDLPLEKERDP